MTISSPHIHTYAANAPDTSIKEGENPLNGYDTTSVTTTDEKIKQYLDADGNIVRSRLNILVQMILSDDDEVAKKELKQLYTVGLLGSTITPIGDKTDIGSIGPLLISLIFFAIITIINFIVLFLSSILMVIVRLNYGELIPSMLQSIQSYVLDTVLFKGSGTSSVGIKLFIVVGIIAILSAIFQSRMKHPLETLKSVFFVIIITMVAGTMSYYTIQYHNVLRNVSEGIVNSVFETTNDKKEMEEKALIYILFQEQPYLMRNFGVASVDKISTACNERETPQEQYERLLLDDKDAADGEESYAIHQARPVATGKTYCGNQNMKHRDRGGVEFSISFTSIMSSVTSILLFFPMLFLLCFSLLCLAIGQLRPLTALFGNMKAIFKRDFQTLWNITLQSFIWFAAIPIIAELIKIVFYVMISITRILNEVHPFLTMFFGAVSLVAIILIVKNFDKVWASFKGMMSHMGSFAKAGLSPEGNAWDGFNDHILSPAVSTATSGVNSALELFNNKPLKTKNQNTDDFDEQEPTEPKDLEVENKYYDGKKKSKKATASDENQENVENEDEEEISPSGDTVTATLADGTVVEGVEEEDGSFTVTVPKGKSVMGEDADDTLPATDDDEPIDLFEQNNNISTNDTLEEAEEKEQHQEEQLIQDEIISNTQPPIDEISGTNSDTKQLEQEKKTMNKTQDNIVPEEDVNEIVTDEDEVDIL